VAELDRVLGGGLVPASATLVGGDPGIGKSTLLLQAAASFARSGARVIYVSGEEATAQVRLRAQRLGLTDTAVQLAAETNLRDILTTLDAEAPDLVIIDSIQTMWLDTVDSAPGSVSQVRASAHELDHLRQAARRGGDAGGPRHEGRPDRGPRVVEHMVDTVLYFEGERGHQFRILRSVKNRFGPADEIGVFEMTGAGLSEVANPSALFLSDRDTPAPGSVVFAGIEGTRPVLVEFQALVAPSSLSQPRRAVVGWDGARLSMILAVLEARAGHRVPGARRLPQRRGRHAHFRTRRRSRRGRRPPVRPRGRRPARGDRRFRRIVPFRRAPPVTQAENRLKEAMKLGFSAAILPKGCSIPANSGVSVRVMEDLPRFVGEVFGAG
jgi:DNA repair protein RadA/Sms